MTGPVLVDSLVRSLQVGSLYALMALGITLTMSVVRLPNFAHAEYVTTGAFAALVVSFGLSANPLVVLGLAGLAGAIVAFSAHVVVFRPLEKQNTSRYAMLLASFAVGLILRYILFLLADRFELFDKRIQIPLQIWFREGGLILTNIFFWVVPTSIVLVIALSLLLGRTPLGREMRALATNGELARVLGIPVGRIEGITWLLVGGLAGIAGALWGMYSNVHPLMGWTAILSVFAAAILGGLSSFAGTILGAYIVSLSENTLMLFLNFYLDVDFSLKPAIPFLIIVLVLLLRPQGLTELVRPQRRLIR